MNTNILSAIKAAYAAGLADGERQFEIIARICAEHTQLDERLVTGLDAIGRVQSGRKPSKTSAAARKAADAPKAPKATVAAKKAKKAPVARTKGVKEGILRHLSGYVDGRTVQDIAITLGYKETSVRGTLMALKKTHAVINQNKLWLLAPKAAQTGSNSEAEARV